MNSRQAIDGLALRSGVAALLYQLVAAFVLLPLGEPLEPSFLAGALLVLAGAMLVSSHGWFNKASRA